MKKQKKGYQPTRAKKFNPRGIAVGDIVYSDPNGDTGKVERIARGLGLVCWLRGVFTWVPLDELHKYTR